jgi:large subunit ribosomal protein L32e
MEKRKKPKFLRRDWNRKVRFHNRRNKLKWRLSKGRHGKTREKRKNRPQMPSIGFGSPREIRGLVKGMNPVMINNLNDLSKVGKDSIAILSSTLGQKKRIQIAEKSQGIKFLNFNPEKVLSERKKKEEKKAESAEVKKENKAVKEIKKVDNQSIREIKRVDNQEIKEIKKTHEGVKA